MSAAPHSEHPGIPVIDIGSLLDRQRSPDERATVAAAIDRACREVGFFAISSHGVDLLLQARLDRAARTFFALPDRTKAEIAMARAGSAWRGWFPVGGELTSGRPDHKEGLYFGLELPDDHPRVVSGTPLHGRNLFPDAPSDLAPTVLEWLDAMRNVADAVMRGIAVGLGLSATWFEEQLTADPTVLFRIFHYPPDVDTDFPDDRDWGVGEHTDYGLLTLLAHDGNPGLQVELLEGTWIDLDLDSSLLVCNIGDMLERLTGGRYRSTPHRVRNTSGTDRLSFPYFFDPSWDATVPTLPLIDASPNRRDQRWDGQDVQAWSGTYGDYLAAKVAKVFPDLFTALRP